jgi:energy-coupling factor transport system substrate-specific component
VNVALSRTDPGRIAAPRLRLRLLLLAAAHLLGVAGFVWPFVAAGVAGPTSGAQRADGPWMLAAFVAIFAALLLLELGRGGLGPKTVALLGVLGAAVVALRLPGFVFGFSAMFLVVLVAGNAFGAGFGFLLGVVGMFASGLFVGGLGPWLPFEMVAFGWVGAGAGLLPHGRTWPRRIAVLATYGFLAGYLYGAVMNLWSWPFVVDGSPISWDPGAGIGANLHHYLSYYALTSFAWDSFRAVGDAVLVVALGRPFLQALDRAARRMHLDVDR